MFAIHLARPRLSPAPTRPISSRTHLHQAHDSTWVTKSTESRSALGEPSHRLDSSCQEERAPSVSTPSPLTRAPSPGDALCRQRVHGTRRFPAPARRRLDLGLDRYCRRGVIGRLSRMRARIRVGNALEPQPPRGERRLRTRRTNARLSGRRLLPAATTTTGSPSLDRNPSPASSAALPRMKPFPPVASAALTT